MIESQEEFEAMMFGAGHCTLCGETKKLAMVEMGRKDAIGMIEFDPAAPRRGFCHDCAMARFSRKH